MNRIMSIVILLGVTCLITQPVYAHIFRLSSNKTTFEPGDEIVINLEVKNTMDIEKTMVIYVSIEEEKGNYPPSAKLYSLKLSPGESRNITVYNTNVSEFMVNGEYVIYAQLIEDGFTLYEDEISFSITGLPEAMEIDILLSNDSDFSFLKDVFVLNERIYIGYNSSLDDINLNCEIAYPDNSSKTVTLPYSFNAEQVGLYSLNISANKENYRSFNKNFQFAVIASIPFYERKTAQPEFPLTYIILSVVIAIILLFSIAKIRQVIK
ncbi:MAG TPA: hypothetical protein ENI49_07255 [Thermoplasmatales archaeon]|nr:hypothetical protein [Thermoplasmatales archaeon]